MCGGVVVAIREQLTSTRFEGPRCRVSGRDRWVLGGSWSSIAQYRLWASPAVWLTLQVR